MKLQCDKEKPNVTPKGVIPFTWFFIIDKLPKCAECKSDIGNNDNAYYCFLSKKLFCWSCSENNPFICHKHFATFENHSDRVVKIRIDNDG